MVSSIGATHRSFPMLPVDGVEKITRRPSLDQSFVHALPRYESSGASPPVPFAARWKSSDTPSRTEVNASRLPSGDHTGALPPSNVSRVRAPVRRSRSQMLVLPLDS